MNTETENRRHLRIPLNWPVIFETPHGRIFGETSNICVNGARILCPYITETYDEFEILLTPHEYHYMPVTCEKAWSSGFLADAFFNISIGVHFTEISFDDQEIIDSLIEKYYQEIISKTKSRCKVTHSPFIN